jgi:hypothetical protein
MIATVDVNSFNKEYIFFCDPIKNNIIQSGKFIRLIYSPPYFSMNGLFCHFSLTNVFIEKYYSKCKCTFASSSSAICQLIDIEHELLEHYKSNTGCSKLKQTSMRDIASAMCIKFFHKSGVFGSIPLIHFSIKISGIWETDTHFGITYKFSRA